VAAGRVATVYRADRRHAVPGSQMIVALGISMDGRKIVLG
jgi:hypothetical protein